MLMMQVGGDYHRFQDIYDLLAKVLPYDKPLKIACADDTHGGGQTAPTPQPVMMAQPVIAPQPAALPAPTVCIQLNR